MGVLNSSTKKKSTWKAEFSGDVGAFFYPSLHANQPGCLLPQWSATYDAATGHDLETEKRTVDSVNRMRDGERLLMKKLRDHAHGDYMMALKNDADKNSAMPFWAKNTNEFELVCHYINYYETLARN